MLNAGGIVFDVVARTKGVNRAVEKMNRLEKEADKLNKTLRLVKGAISAVGTSIIARFLKDMTLFTDEWHLLNDRVKAVTKTNKEAEKTFKNLVDISKKTGSEVGGLINNFAKLSLTKDSVNATNEQMLEVLGTLTKIGVIGGQNMGVVNSAILQFSQGLTTGTFQAQEFQSVSEGLTGILPLLAEEMGLTSGELQRMKKEGKVKSLPIFEAVLRMTDKVNERFDKMPTRIGRAWNTFKLGAKQGLGEMDAIFKVTERIAAMLIAAGDAMSKMGKYTEAVKQGLEAEREAYRATERTKKNLEVMNGILEKVKEKFSFIGKKTKEIYSGAVANNFSNFSEGFKKALEKKPPEVEDKDPEIENTKKKYSILLDLQKSFLKGKQDIQNAYNDSILRGKKAYEQAVLDGETSAAKQAIAIAADTSKTMFEINKAMSIAEILLAAPTAIGQAIAWGSKYGPIVAGAAGATVGAAVGASLAAVTSTSFTPPRAVGGDIFPNRVYKVNENQPELFNFGGNEFLSTGSARGNINPSTNSNSSSSPMVNVVINTLPGQTAEVSQGVDENNNVLIEVLMKKIQDGLAKDVSEGTGEFNNTLEQTFGLNRALGAFT